MSFIPLGKTIIKSNMHSNVSTLKANFIFEVPGGIKNLEEFNFVNSDRSAPIFADESNIECCVRKKLEMFFIIHLFLTL